MKRFFISYLVIFSFIFFYGCRKDIKNELNNNEPNTGVIQPFTTQEISDLEDFIQADFEAHVTIQEHHTFDNDEVEDILVIASFDPSKDCDSLVISDTEIDKGDSAYCWSRENDGGGSNPNIYGFGTRFSAYLDGTLEFTDSIYFPDALEVTFSDSAVSEGDTIFYNQDGSNGLGVVLLVQFVPEHSEMIGKTHTEEAMQNFKFDTDNGQFIIPSGTFTGVPDSAIVMIALIRGNYSTVVSEDDTQNLAYWATSATSGLKLYVE